MAMLPRTFTILALTALIGCQSPESHMSDGDDLYQRGYYDQALRHYQLARRSDPMLPGIEEKIRSAQIRMYIAQGDQLTQSGQWDDARRAYEEVRRIDRNNAEVGERLAQLENARAGHHFARGTQLLSEGNPFDAIPELEQTLALQPDHPRASAALLRALDQKREQERRAETTYERGLQARDSGRLEEALRYFEETVALNPFHVGAAHELRRAEAAIVDLLLAQGDEAMAARRFADALTAYREAQLSLPPLGSQVSIERRTV